jgi:hypothetical protein
LFEHAGVGNRLRHVNGELRQDVLIALAERARPIAQEVQRSQYALFVAERHGELRLDAGNRSKRPRIVVDVVDQNRPLFRDGGAHDALAELQADRADDFFRIPFRVRDAQVLLLLIDQVNRKDLEGGEACYELRDSRQQLVEIEDGADFTPKLEERGEDFLVEDFLMLFDESMISDSNRIGRVTPRGC